MAATLYRGRFAPSPTGPLHFGSLVAALASYLDAKAHAGEWYVRIEDIDPPREVSGSSTAILKALEVYGLTWDGELVWQHDRYDAYREAITQLRKQGVAYPCTCSRKELAEYHNIYPGTCRKRTDDPVTPFAIRLNCGDDVITFNDQIQGKQRFDMTELGDFIIFRKDQLFAYQLAVTVDDACQGITHIVRGSDLLDSTPRQICLQRHLNVSTPVYAHIPVIINPDGSKLSKQNLAPPLPLDNPIPMLLKALHALHIPADDSMMLSDPETILTHATSHWSPTRLPHTLSILELSLPSVSHH
ncbi:tRNA glutamyl-Q(34) synthetase GluQRS [Kistimonas asteriae]|uniref:tRNA glutamyl-Q(34) synthetase GluQRS n=1 Tax=Kistimonas asteriae TaxID=517724 RepID=UPI001BA9AE3C|nr:tRNA glutamyl-Q(34) synthetase GluQRS [Kistimonas asteriae]